MQEDAILVQKTLEGDEQAFHRLIMKYYAKIYALILSWVKNPEDAKDLVQEVFLEAYLDLDSLRHREQFRIWLHQIARHQCQDWLRKEKTYVQLDENIICETPLADETLILRETLAKVMKAIDELPKSESQLLKERYLDDVSYDDLEARHGLSHSVLAMRLFRAREKVRQSVEKLLAGIGIFSWHDALNKMLSGGAKAMEIGIKTKLIVSGIALLLILGGTGILVNKYYTQNESRQRASQTLQESHSNLSAKSVSGKSKSLIKDNAISSPDNSNSALDSYSKNDAKVLSSHTTDAVMASGVELESKKDKNKESQLTIEQQYNLDIVTRTVPRWFGLHDWFIELDREENRKPPERISGDELGVWLRQRDQEVELKYPSSLKRERYAEQKRIETELMKKFPTAVYYKKEGGMEGVFFDFVKLRELCGGKLPIAIGN